MGDALYTASNSTHYAMCKIDYLGTGICEAGLRHRYVSYYPQGRMGLYYALMNELITVTEKCIEIEETCDLCGNCDYQCSFYTGMRPTKHLMGLTLSPGAVIDLYRMDSIQFDGIR
jgi:hypothetical protein